MISFTQALRNAIAAEQAAARFYRGLAAAAATEQVRQIFEEMAEQEEGHALGIEEMGRKLADRDLPEMADSRVEHVEAPPEWRGVEIDNPVEAYRLALEAENGAALYYDAISDFLGGEEAKFFREIGLTEEGHGEKLRELIAEAEK